MFNLQTFNFFKYSLTPGIRARSLDYQSRALFSQAFDTNKDYYKVLGVSQASTDKQIKAAYFSLAKKYHPDVNKGNSDRFKEISDAYSVIGDDKKRKDYDAARKFSSGTAGFGANRTSQNQQSYGGQYYNNTGYGQTGGYYNNQQQQQKSYYHYNQNNRRDPKSEQEEEMLKSYFKSYYGMQFQDFVKQMNEQVSNQRARQNRNQGYTNPSFDKQAPPEPNSSQYYWDSKKAEEEYRKKREEEYRRMEEDQKIRKQNEEEMVKEAQKKFNEFVGKVSGVGVFIKNLAEDFTKKFKK